MTLNIKPDAIPAFRQKSLCGPSEAAEKIEHQRLSAHREMSPRCANL
jgi:hypothetical protein